MAGNAFKVRAVDAAKHIHLHVTITGWKRQRFRIWLASWISRFGAFVAGMPVHITGENKHDRIESHSGRT